MEQHRLGFLRLGVTGILGDVILCCGSCPVHCRMFSHITVSLVSIHQIPHPPPLVTTKNASDVTKCQPLAYAKANKRNVVL